MKLTHLGVAYLCAVLGLLLINGALFCYFFQDFSKPWREYPYREFWGTLMLVFGGMILAFGVVYLLYETDETKNPKLPISPKESMIKLAKHS